MVGVEGIQRGEIWWADLPEPRHSEPRHFQPSHSEPSHSEPGHRRPVLVVQADAFNRSRIQTAIVSAITTHLELAGSPGNIFLPERSAGLTRASVVNVSQLLALDRGFLTEYVGTLTPRLQRSVEEGLRTVLQL